MSPAAPAYGPPGRAVGAWFGGGGVGAPWPAWHGAVPASVNVLPATGTNFHEYDAESSVSCNTPNVVLLRTSLFAAGVPNG